MLTSKEVLEKTGISRATLNNYIGSGLLPRPDVLPPSEGAAPRMGHFPDDTLARIEEIQRLKAQGWSIGRIAQHFSGGAPVPAAAAPQAAWTPAASAPQPARPSLPAAPSLADVPPAAYTVGPALDLLWCNEHARSGPIASWLAWPAAWLPGASVLHMLLAEPPGLARDSLVAFHLQVARQRGADLAQLVRGLTADQSALMQARFSDAPEVDPAAVLRTVFTPVAGGPAWAAYAAPMHEGTLFLYAPAAETLPAGLLAAGAAAPSAVTPPELADVAVLVAELQGAGRLWRQLPAQEYFELVNEIWLTLEPVLRARGGVQGRHSGDGLAAYFLARTQRDYLQHSVLAALELREAMAQISRRWQQRKGWTTQLCVNIGVAEGQEWIGSLRPAAPDEWTVLGAAADQAAWMARLGRGGSVWATRSLIGKLERERPCGLKYAAPRAPGEGSEPLVLASFARLQDVVPERRQPPEFSDLAVAEVLAFPPPSSGAASLPGARPHPA